MIFNIRGETLLLLIRSFLAGVVLGAVYDIFRAALTYRSSGGRGLPRWVSLLLSAVFDFIFCILCAVSALLLMYYSNRGFFRASVIPVMLAGFLCFRCSLGKILGRVLSWAYGVIWKIILILTFPVRFIFLKMILLLRLTIGKIIGKIVAGARAHIKADGGGMRDGLHSYENTEGEEKSDVAGATAKSGKNTNGRAYRAYGRIKF